MIPPCSPFTTRALLAGGGLLLAMASPGLMRADPLPTPLIQYNFDEGTGSTAANSGSLGAGSSLSFEGAYTGHVSWASAASTLTGTGSALVMDGVTRGTSVGYVDGDGTALNTNLSAFTLTLWVNLTTASGSDRLVAFEDNTNGFDLRLNTVSGNDASLTLWVDGSTRSSTASVTVVGQWAFIAVSYDGTQTTNNVSFYSGTSSISASLLGNAGNLNTGSVNTVVNNLTTALRVGSAASSGGTDRTPAGAFDNIAIYDGVLDASQIEGIRSSALAVIPEPSSIALIFASASLLAAGMFRRRRR